MKSLTTQRDCHYLAPSSTGAIVTPCACAAGGRVIGLCLSVCPLVPYSCSNEGLVETLLHNTIVRIQKSLAST